MRSFNLLKKKEDRKRLIGVCPINKESCFNAVCGGGCSELKVRSNHKVISV